ncbi:MAG: SelB C-terminal domain-containing protein [Gluconacetobacter diazotrophicus]|nr:SelB C-terminal domain-containing protein [Gluconacetobacter diazotrophicus]
MRRRDALYSIPDAARDQANASRDARELAALAEMLRAGGLMPPDLPGDPRTRRLLDALLRGGVAVRTTDRVQKRDIVFHAEAVAGARRLLAAALGNGGDGMSVGEAGAALGITRKYSVPLLEHLDAIGFTVRRGDRRRLAA